LRNFYLGTGKSKTIAGIVMKLLPQLDRNRKILLCAPSNNACDELSKRILNEISPDYETGY
jgi:superfamily I DNA and/or RNA helicase